VGAEGVATAAALGLILSAVGADLAFATLEAGVFGFLGAFVDALDAIAGAG